MTYRMGFQHGIMDCRWVIAQASRWRRSSAAVEFDVVLRHAAVLGRSGLSMTTDLTAVSFVFPCEDGGYDVLPSSEFRKMASGRGS